MRVTQKDIARKLNVSQSLVAGVLTNNPAIRTTADNRRRVLAAAHEMDYVANRAARSLRRGKTHVVAFAVSLSEDGLGSLVASGIQGLPLGLAALGYDMLWKILPTASDQALAALSDMVASNVCDAFVLWGPEPAVREQGELLCRLEAPFIVKGRHERTHPDWPQVDFDHEFMSRRAVEYLASRGHKRIAYLGTGRGQAYSDALLASYRNAMRDYTGHGPDEADIAIVDEGPHNVDDTLFGWLTRSQADRPTALVLDAVNLWTVIEIVLARRGTRIGPASDELEVFGDSSEHTALIFGNAWACRTLTGDLIAAMIEKLARPVLAGTTPSATVVRLRPGIQVLPSFNLSLPAL